MMIIIYDFGMHHRSVPTQYFNIDSTDQIRLGRCL